MAKVKNVSGEDRIVQGRLVLSGAVLEVPDEDVKSYTCQTNWQAVKSPKSADNDNSQEG